MPRKDDNKLFVRLPGCRVIANILEVPDCVPVIRGDQDHQILKSFPMRWLVLIAFILGARLIRAQAIGSSASPELLFACDGKHPQPCATTPRTISTPEPEYSEEARKKCFQGTVELGFIVGPDGSVQQVEVVKPLGMGLDEAAIGAVRTWKFEPGTRDGKPVAVKLSAEVSFNLLMTDCKAKKSKKAKPRK
jgi:TonB family protein